MAHPPSQPSAPRPPIRDATAPGRSPTVLLVGDAMAALADGADGSFGAVRHLAADATHARLIAQWLRPDVLVIDLRDASATDLDLVDHIQEALPVTGVVAVVAGARADDLARTVGPACGLVLDPGHQLPCAIEATLRARGSLARVLPQLEALAPLPGRPAVQAELLTLTSDPATALEDVAAAVERDIAAVTEILRLVNSAHFGLATRVDSVLQAVRLLGVDIIRGMAVASAVYRGTTSVPVGLDLSDLAARSLHVATNARRVAQLEQWPADVRSDLFVAGLLHDVGLLVLATADPAGWALLREVRTSGGTSDEVAQAVAFGCTVAEASSAVLHHWGFTGGVTETLAASVTETLAASVVPVQAGRGWRPPAAAALVAARWWSRPGAGTGRPDDAWLDDRRWSRWQTVTGGTQQARVPTQSTGDWATP